MMVMWESQYGSKRKLCEVPVKRNLKVYIGALAAVINENNVENELSTIQSSKGSCATFNPLPDDKILDWSELKQIADNILTHSHTMTPFDAPGKQAF